MVKLQDISEIPSAAIELLEAVGYMDVEDLVAANVSALHSELLKANETLRILPENPTPESIIDWQKAAVGMAEKEDHSVAIELKTATLEDDPEFIEILTVVPTVEFIPPALIQEQQLAVSDIPEGILLSECDRELGMEALTKSRLSDRQRRKEADERTGLVTSRIRGFDQADSQGHIVKPLDAGTPMATVIASEGLNEGVDENSKRFIRGVLHPSSGKIRGAAFCSLFVQISMVVALIAIPWAVIHEYQSGDNMVFWVVGLSILLLLAALSYLIWGIGASCRVCGQRIFVPKKCLKNKKAHRIPLIGYIFPTALHALVYKWFYCIYCGTAVRLKK